MQMTPEELNALLDAAYQRGKTAVAPVTFPPMTQPYYPGDTIITYTDTGAQSQ